MAKEESPGRPRPSSSVTLAEAVRLVNASIRGASAREVLDQLVIAIANVLQADIVFVGRIHPEDREVTTMAQVVDGAPAEPLVYRLAETPCDQVTTSGACVFPEAVRDRFPDDLLLQDLNIEAYVGTPLTDRGGNPVGLLVALFRHPLTAPEQVLDILRVFATRAASELERMRIETELQNAHDRYRRFFEEDITGDYISTLEGKLVDANPAFLEMFGFDSLEEARNFNMAVLYDTPKDRVAFLERLQRERTIANLEMTVRRKDGTPIRIRENVTGDFDETGKLVGLRGYIMDITEESRSLRELEESRHRYMMLFEHTPDGILLADAETGCIIDVNPAFARLAGRPREALIGMHQSRLYPADPDGTARKQFQAHVEQAKREGTTSLLRQAVVRPDGTEVPVEIKADAVEVGGRFMLQGVFRDISERMKAEAAQRDLAAREERYRSLVELSPDPIYVLRGRRLLMVNDAWLNLFGYERDEVLSDDFDIMGIIAPDCRDMVEQKFATPDSEKPAVTRYELGVLTRDGQRLDLDVVVSQILWEGEPAVQGIYRNITEAKNRERQLKETTLRLETAQQVARIGFIDWNLKTDQVFLSDTTIELFGLDPTESFVGMNLVAAAVHPDDRDMVARGLEGAIRGEPYNLDHRIVRPRDGRTIWVHAQTLLIRDADGQPERLLGTAQDITERKLAEDALRESEEKFRTLAEFMPVGVMIYREDGFAYVNPAARDICGYTDEELKRMPFWEMVHPDHRELVRQRGMARLQGDEPPRRYEFKIIRKDGVVRWIDFAGTRIQYEGKPAGIIVVQDITDRKSAEADLRKLNQAVEQAPVAVVITDTDGTIEFVNSGFETLTGYSRKEAVGQNPRILKSGEHTDALYREMWETITAGRTWQGELCNKRKDGSLCWVQVVISPVTEADGRIINYVGVQLDISDRKQLEAERDQMEAALQQAQKLDTVGTLAGGIAHDFNNILTPILGYAQLAKARIPENNRAFEHVDRIEQAAGRAKDLVQQILTFSRRVEHVKEPLLPGPIFKEALKLLRASIPASIEFDIHIDDDAGTVIGDPTQLHQVLMNLCTNAAHAMEPDGGTLTVSLKRREASPEELRRTGLAAGAYVVLTVADTGHGIPDDIQDRVFEPFFTTKESGKGTGMGLSVVHGIIKSHDGGILLDSTPGSGTTVTVFLPAKPDTGDATRSRPSVELPDTGEGRILVVDDEDIVRDMHRDGLASLGYTVHTAASGAEALAHVQADPTAVDLVLTDLTMPKMSGYDLAVQLHRLRPDLPIIMATGYNEQLTPDMAEVSGIRRVLTKPCRIRELHEAIQQALRGE